MDIRCHDHVHRVEVSLSSEPRFDYFRSADNPVDYRLVTYELHIQLSVDGLRPVGAYLRLEQVQQDNTLILSVLSRVIEGLFSGLPPCLRGNAEGWVQFAYAFMNAHPGIRYDVGGVRRFMIELGSLVSSHTNTARRIERHVNDRPVPLMNGMDEELVRLMQANREEIAHAFMIPADQLDIRIEPIIGHQPYVPEEEFRNLYRAGWYVGRGDDETVTIAAENAEATVQALNDLRAALEQMSAVGDALDPAAETAKALFEKMMPWAAEQLKRDNQIVLDTCPSRLKYVIWSKTSLDQIRVYDGSPADGSAYRGWLCLEVNLPGGRVPTYDRLLQRLLLLQHDEKKVWRVAYFHHDGSKASFQLMNQMGGRAFGCREYANNVVNPSPDAYARYNSPIQHESDFPEQVVRYDATVVDPDAVKHAGRDYIRRSMRDSLYRWSDGA